MTDVFTPQTNAAFGGHQHTREQIDECGFPRAIGTNERMACTTGNLQADMVGGGDAAKAFHQTVA